MRPVSRPFARLRSVVVPLAVAAAAIAPRAALADAASLTVPAGAGQDALWIRVHKAGIDAESCPGACTGGGAKPVPDIPADVLPALPSAKTSTITLADGKKVARVDVDIPAKEGELPGAWTLLLAAPLSSAKGGAPVVLWSGHVGKKSGLEGEASGSVVRVEPLPKGSRVVIGQQREDLTICGRPAIVSAREIEPATLTLSKTAMVDNLSADDKKKAEKVVAVRETGPAPAPTIRLLRANAASSALEKRIDSLTDGGADLGWTEAKIGDGRGEWVRMSASTDVPIAGLSVQIRPTAVEVPDGAAPKSFYFATDDRLFQVELPDSAWSDRDARYEIKLPMEVRTACLAVVLESAHAPKGVTNPRVTLAEVTARTALDAMSYDALAAALAGGVNAKAAAALLGKGDGRAVAAVKGTWDKLDAVGRGLAMEVVDGAPCGDQASFYAELLAQTKTKKLDGPGADPTVTRARDRLRRCGRASAPALAKLLQEAPDPVRVVAADEIALVAPPEGIAAILDVLSKAPDPVRRDMRGALARAAKSPKSQIALAEWVTPEKFGSIDEVSRIDLLRAMGPVLPDVEGGKAALFGLLGKDVSFRSRYLLLAPAAELAARGDAEAVSLVKDALVKDADPHVRARAAEVTARVLSFAAELVTAAGDAEVRVREAAVRALAQSAGQGQTLPATAEAALVGRLTGDDWTFVRAGAADALLAMPANASIDKALAGALSDASPDVRGRALDGLGAHQARAHAAAVRDRAEDKDETPDVRARALLALGAMCDKGSLDLLTRVAQGARSLSSELDRRLGAAALAALGDIHPADLADRISLLTAGDAPVLVREMAKAALAAKSTCESK